VKIVLFGRHGKLARELQRTLAPLGELLVFGSDDADFRRPDALAALLRAARPQVVVNAAAYNAVDRAEREPGLAAAVNATAPGVLAREAGALGAWLLHYGSDYVFDGSGERPWDEAAPTGPLSVYGHSKLVGEQQVQASGCRHLILRTSWLHAPGAECFPRTVLRLAAERDRLEVVDDQIGAPTGADLVAEVSAQALRIALQRPEVAGLYHVAAAGHTSRHACAAFVLDWARAQGLPLKATAPVAVSTRAAANLARRPLNSRLDTRKLCDTFGLSLPAWQAGVARTLGKSAP
jgi:dTDP-4-dehydrorhamnose reductase